MASVIGSTVVWHGRCSSESEQNAAVRFATTLARDSGQRPTIEEEAGQPGLFWEVLSQKELSDASIVSSPVDPNFLPVLAWPLTRSAGIAAVAMEDGRPPSASRLQHQPTEERRREGQIRRGNPRNRGVCGGHGPRSLCRCASQPSRRPNGHLFRTRCRRCRGSKSKRCSTRAHPHFPKSGPMRPQSLLQRLSSSVSASQRRVYCFKHECALLGGVKGAAAAEIL